MISRRVFVGSAMAVQASMRAAGQPAVWQSVVEASVDVQARKVSPVELTRLCLDRIDKLNATLDAFITVLAERALEQAKVLEAELQSGRSRGPWHGIPIALKDLFDAQGVRTTAGSKQWSTRVPDADAEVVRRLKAAGAIVIGKANMDEFAYNFTGETSAFGTCKNPWNPRRSPGGSSGGSAAAVASGMCFAALGSDTGGSIRLPAAFCGITGFKPTYGVVSTAGVAPLAWSLDHVGPMCRGAADASLMLAALTGRSSAEVASVSTLRLGVPRALFYDNLDAHVDKALASATSVLGRLTAGARDVKLPALEMSKDLPDLPQPYIQVISAEAYAFHENMLREHPDLYNPGTRKSIEGGASITAAQYIRARREMDRLRPESARLFESADLLITPTAPGAAFEFGEHRLMYLRNTAPWNLYGLPTISIPCGFTPEGLPIGLQITGRAGQDATVLAAAAAFQKETDWHQRHP